MKNKNMTVPQGNTLINVLFADTHITVGVKDGVFGFVFTDSALQTLSSEYKFIPLPQADNVFPLFVLGHLLSRN